ncbi:MAG TPA: TIGR04283 family arsenosugar biosynthesis glycosyltransferase [Flavisolibacter sp.]|jgi:rSAM/selenodomain-associated transferase 2|nr:TIGR04283 family arsenosugar biosynthesis glycosyltransferase [Flavisolibacter sp.]
MISVVIPTFNEVQCIAHTIRTLRENDRAGLIVQIIISDGGSTDGTLESAKSEGAIVIMSPRKGRAAQMNAGALAATGEVLYFLHADTLPPTNFTGDIADAVQNGFSAGCFRLSFDHSHWFLRANCWFTRFDVDAIRFGDQSLFVQKKIFTEMSGFCEKHVVMEDQEIIKRLKKKIRFTVLKKSVITSSRKYLENGIYKTQAIFFVIYFMYRLGYPQHQLISTYRKLIRQDKL